MAKILIVDDESELVEMLAFRLKKTAGYETLTANDGEAGLRLAREERPDLIVLDLWMPKMDGFQVMEQLKQDERTASIPVIVLTASASPKTIQKIKDQGTCDCVVKPFDPQELLGKIKKGLENRHV